MRHRTALLPIVAAAMIAGCQDAPVTAPEAARHNVNQAPVAVIVNWYRKPIGGTNLVRYELHGRNSYDPDGSIVQYYWYPEYHCRIDPAYGDSYYIDVPAGDSCGITLTVTDDGGATNSVTTYYVRP